MQAGVIRRTVASAALAIASAVASGQISLASAVDLALRNDPRVKMAEADSQKARAALSEARDAYYPVVNATAGVGESVGVPLQVPVIFGLSSQSLVFNFSQKDYIRAAAAGLNAAELALRESREKVSEDVVLTYLNLDTAEQRHTAMLEEFADANRLVTIVQERLDAGADTQLELLKVKRTSAQIHLASLQVEDEVTELNDHLARALGLPGMPITTVPSSIPAMPALDSFAVETAESPGIESAFASAQGKLQTAFGESRYLYRPQVALGANYSRISTDFTNYSLYYPGFDHPGNSKNAISVGVQIQLPLFDRSHMAKAREASADAVRSHFEAENQLNQFLEGRYKLRRTAQELQARSELAGLDRDLAREQLRIVTTELAADNASTGAPQMTPKDEANARVQERQRYIDLLAAQYELRQAEVNLLRQTGQLDAWLHDASAAPANEAVTPKHP